MRETQREHENLNKNVRLLDPKNVLKRGFSITYLNGKAVKSYSRIKENVEVETILYSGGFKSKIISINKEK